EGVRATPSASIAPPRLAIAAELGSTLRGTTFVTSSDSPFEGAGGRGVELFGYTAGEIRLAAGDDSVIHGLGHEHGVLRKRDAGVHEHCIRAEFHGDGGVGGRAHACVHDERHGGYHLAQ